MLIIPKVCAWCNSVKYIECKDERKIPKLNEWMLLSHTICPECKEKELKKIKNTTEN